MPCLPSSALSLSLTPLRCAFHANNYSHRLFERGAGCVGLDFLAHPFWDKFLEFEERLEAYDKMFAILGRIIHIPMHQYARYFEKYRQFASTQPLPAIVPAGTLTQFRMDLENEGAGYKAGRTEAEVERELRIRVDNFHLEIFHRTQAETTKRWTYES
jgi:pre-mRNA-processing factor 39